MRPRPDVTSRASLARAEVPIEVIVQPDQLRAIQRLVKAAAEGGLEVEALPPDVVGLAPVTIQPIPLLKIDVPDVHATAGPALPER